jgi:hypothetical protein
MTAENQLHCDSPLSVWLAEKPSVRPVSEVKCGRGKLRLGEVCEGIEFNQGDEDEAKENDK